jgi:hypothetical protein
VVPSVESPSAAVCGTPADSPEVQALTNHAAVAVTIDTQDSPEPPSTLQLRGAVTIAVHADVFDE